MNIVIQNAYTGEIISVTPVIPDMVVAFTEEEKPGPADFLRVVAHRGYSTVFSRVTISVHLLDIEVQVYDNANHQIGVVAAHYVNEV